MSAVPFNRVHIQVGTWEYDHPWYECGAAGCRMLAGDPDPFRALMGVVVAHRCAAVLYNRGGAWGVYWGRMPNGESDTHGRSMGFTLLVEFVRKQDAADFLAGVLGDWWPFRDAGVPDLGSRAREAVRPGNEGTDIVRPYLRACLETWKAGDRPRLEGGAAADAPLHAGLSDARLAELRVYLRGGLAESPWGRGRSAFEPGVVVTTSIVLDRLGGVWRALTDHSPSPDWTGFTRAKQQSAAHPVPEAEATAPTLLGGVIDRIKELINHFGAPDRGKSTTFWLEVIQNQPERSQEAEAALIYRATRRDEERTRGVRDRLLDRLSLLDLDPGLSGFILTVLKGIAEYSVSVVGKPGADALAGLERLAATSGVNVSGLAREVWTRFGMGAVPPERMEGRARTPAREPGSAGEDEVAP